MGGETDLDRLIAGMSARLADGFYVFATVAADEVPPAAPARMRFEEAEGVTLILSQDEADAHGVPHEFPCRMITLEVHSSLAAVGFLARVTAALAAEGIAVNAVSGFHHDHLFVPDGREEDAMRVLKALSKGV